MQKFIGVKLIAAMAMTSGLASQHTGRPVEQHERGRDGYLVEYEDGYKSWSPKDVFEAAYRRADAMTFGLAIEALKRGERVARAGWNGKGMWLMLMGAGDTTLPNGENYPALPFLVMKTVGEQVVPWLASQTDMLAEDWSIVS